ncbi:MAG: two-component regulator propeller domain-containing protein [Chloroflexota bacterium]
MIFVKTSQLHQAQNNQRYSQKYSQKYHGRKENGVKGIVQVAVAPVRENTDMWRKFALFLLFCLIYTGLSTCGFIAKPAQALSIQEPPLWTLFNREQNGLTSNNVWSLLVVDDEIWVGTATGISRFNGVWMSYPSIDELKNIPENKYYVPSGVVVTLVEGRTPGTIWAGTDRGHIAFWDGQRWANVLSVASQIITLQEMDDGLWIGTQKGLLKWSMQGANTGDIARLDREPMLVEELGDIAVHAILDSSHQLMPDIFVGTQNGLWRYRAQGGDEPEWSLVDTTTLPNPTITSLWEEESGRLWVGTPSSLHWRYPIDTAWFDLEVRDRHDEPVLIQTLAGDNQGGVWVGTDGGGARKFVDGGHVTIDAARPLEGGRRGLTSSLVRDIAIDKDGSIWFGTHVGVFRYQERVWINDFQSGEQFSININATNDMLIDHQDTLWVATAGAGIRRKSSPLVRGEVIYNTQNSRLPDDGVLTLTQDHEKGIWAGTMNGVARFANNRWTIPVHMRFLPHPVVTRLLADGDTLWIGTENGLVTYNIRHGELTTLEEFGGQIIEALVMDSYGRVWVGTDQSGVWINTNGGDGSKGSEVEWINQNASHLEGSLPGNYIVLGGLTADPTESGHMWAIVSGYGLYRWDGTQWHEGDPDHRLPNHFLYTLFSSPVDKSIWIGSEGGATRYDGQSWQTFSSNDGLQSSAIYAFARAADGGYWFGGNEGLSYYQPERTAPWISAELLTTGDENGGLFVGEPLLFEVTVGDLQTSEDALRVFYRVVEEGTSETAGSSTWTELIGNRLEWTFGTIGEHRIEFQVRDMAFNYSEVSVQPITMTEPPVLITVPILGQVEYSAVLTLVILFVITTLIGVATYVSLLMLQKRRKAIEALHRGYNPYISGEPVREADMFYARHSVLRQIIDTLHHNSIMIYGERRIGKTTLLYQLAHRLSTVDDTEYWFAPLYIDLEGTKQENFFHFLIEEIVLGLSSLTKEDEGFVDTLQKLNYLKTESNQYTDRHFNRDLRRVISALTEYGERTFAGRDLRLILLLDEMDVISQYDHLVQQQLRRIFMRDFAATMGAVVAGIQISREWERIESPWYNLFNEIEVEPFGDADALELLTEPVKDYYTYDEAVTDFIIKHSHGRPFRVQQYGLIAVNQMLKAKRRQVLLEDAEYAHQVILHSQNHNHINEGLDNDELNKAIIQTELNQALGHVLVETKHQPRYQPAKELLGQLPLNRQQQNSQTRNQEARNQRVGTTYKEVPGHA